MKETEEIWKDITGYEGYYQVSNLGRVKSLERMLTWSDGRRRKVESRILKLQLSNTGYYQVSLHIGDTSKTTKVHKLVAIAFLNHIPCGYELVVNHKDCDKLNNHVDNLELVTNRENSNQKHLGTTSKYVGVSWDKRNKRWRSAIRIGKGRKWLGSFKNEIDAHNAYQEALKQLQP